MEDDTVAPEWQGPNEKDWVDRIAEPSKGLKDETLPWIKSILDISGLIEKQILVTKFVSKGGRLHTKAECKESRKQGAPKNCVFHKPTIHRLTGSVQILRASALIEDMCEHKVGHPNPDSAAYLNWRDSTTTWYIHGCDGCCGDIVEQDMLGDI